MALWLILLGRELGYRPSVLPQTGHRVGATEICTFEYRGAIPGELLAAELRLRTRSGGATEKPGSHYGSHESEMGLAMHGGR